MNRVARRRRWVAMVGLAGGVLGVAAGIVQVFVGADIPQWSGAKSAPVALGLLTIGLSLLSGWGAVAQRGQESVRGRAGYALTMIGPGLLCLSTVGALWYVPAALLVVAGLLTVEDWPGTGLALTDDWFRVLLSALGGFEILMAAGASALLLVVGVVTGLVLMITPWLRSASRTQLAGLIVAGTVPFAVLGWTAVVPVLLALVVAVVAIPLLRHRVPAASAHGPIGSTR